MNGKLVSAEPRDHVIAGRGVQAIRGHLEDSVTEDVINGFEAVQTEA